MELRLIKNNLDCSLVFEHTTNIQHQITKLCRPLPAEDLGHREGELEQTGAAAEVCVLERGKRVAHLDIGLLAVWVEGGSSRATSC